MQYDSDYSYMVPNRYSHHLSGTSHLVAVILVAALAAVFPVTISAHGSAVQTATPAATHGVEVAAFSPTTRQAGPNLWSATHVQRVPAVATKKAIPAHAAIRKNEAAKHPSVPAPASTAPSQPAVPASQPAGYGCTAALAYLKAHAAPGFTLECPGYAEGHQAMTCMNIAGVCPGAKLIAISVPCAAAYMNESSNSWVLTGESNAPIDPYGYCS